MRSLFWSLGNMLASLQKERSVEKTNTARLKLIIIIYSTNDVRNKLWCNTSSFKKRHTALFRQKRGVGVIQATFSLL